MEKSLIRYPSSITVIVAQLSQWIMDLEIAKGRVVVTGLKVGGGPPHHEIIWQALTSNRSQDAPPLTYSLVDVDKVFPKRKPKVGSTPFIRSGSASLKLPQPHALCPLSREADTYPYLCYYGTILVFQGCFERTWGY